MAASKISECSGRYVSGLLNGLTSFVNDALELHDYMAAIERHKVGEVVLVVVEEEVDERRNFAALSHRASC